MTPTGCLLCESLGVYFGKDCPACGGQTMTMTTTHPPPRNPTELPADEIPQRIALGRYTVLIHPGGRRSLLSEGQAWLDAMPGTVVWELIDKILTM